MKNSTINLQHLLILVADPSAYMRMITLGILRGFGANKILETSDSFGVITTLTEQKIDVLICDAQLPPQGGVPLVRAIRRNVDNENRTIPILIMTSDTRESTIKRARDAGTNIVVAKPLSPANLYNRLSWIVSKPRQFVDPAINCGQESKAIQRINSGKPTA